MRILALSNLYPPHSVGGYEDRCRRIVDRLRTRGHEVRVLTSTHGVPQEGEEGHVHRKLRLQGVFGHPALPLQRLFALERDNQRVLKETLKAFSPDVVHVWGLGGLGKALTLQLQEKAPKVVYDVSDHWIARGLKKDAWLGWWNEAEGVGTGACVRKGLRATGLAEWTRRAAPYAAWDQIKFERIYFCSQALKRVTIEHGYPLEHAGVIYCGIETGRFRPRPVSDRFTRLLYVGRFCEERDPLTAIRALKELPEHFTLSLYGRGESEYMRRLEAEAGPLNGRVKFRTATNEAMADVYAEHDALLFPAAWEEPFALMPLEAMAARLPVISTLAGGSRELIRHGENARSFAVGDHCALAAEVEAMEADSTAREAMIERAHLEVIGAYDLETITSQIERYLAEA
jgi:glycosyltransferase involved in cell wall biosynthesis